ncbi:MAG: VanZ family protein [Desulfohalobiaceae bacterium]|nr:VanZ family protein [Desulfohalobiaceae bacterium]
MQKAVLTRALQLGWLASVMAVAYLSLKPGIRPPGDFGHIDKAYHFLSYCWLAFLPLLAFAKQRTAMNLSLAMIGLGLGLEFIQYFLPARTLSGLDFLANSLGVGLGLWLGLKLRPLVLVEAGK